MLTTERDEVPLDAIQCVLRTASVMLALILTGALVAGCASVHKRAMLRDPAEAVRVLRRQGYTAPTLPRGAPGSQTAGQIAFRFDTRYGEPVAYLHKDDLYVMVARGNSHTLWTPYGLWRRFGNTVVIGYPSRPSGLAQFQALLEGL